jgi:hypothetical protein
MTTSVSFSQTAGKKSGVTKRPSKSSSSFSPANRAKTSKGSYSSTSKSNNFSNQKRSTTTSRFTPSRTSQSLSKRPVPSKGSSSLNKRPVPSKDFSGLTKRPVPGKGSSSLGKRPVPIKDFSGLTKRPIPTKDFSGLTKRPVPGKDLSKVPGNKQFENLVDKIKVPNGKTIKPINLAGMIKPLDKKVSAISPPLAVINKASRAQIGLPMAMKAKNAAMLHLGLHGYGRCHWWLDFVIGSHWHWNHCHWWDICYRPGYWHCWTPCHYRVVYCPRVVGYRRSAWYFGVECMLIPDLASYGIQEVTVNSPADRAGLQPGDMIVSINGLSIHDESVLVNAIQSSGGQLVLGVVREGTEEPVMVEVLLDRVPVIST